MVSRSLTSAPAFERALAVLVVLNLIDAVMTSLWVSEGIASEGNPVMAAALGLGLGQFVLGKVVLVGLGAASLYRLREQLLARIAVIPAVVLYCFVLGNHLGISLRVLGLIEHGVFSGTPQMY